MKNVIIGNKLISDNGPCFIIAEAGVNHNGKLSLAKEMVDVAKEAGADAVKFQTFISEDLVTQNIPMEEYQKRNTGKTETQLEMLKKLELSRVDFIKLKKYCEKKGITFLSTPFDENSVDFLEKLGVPAFKVSSGDITDLPFLRHIAKKKLPMIVSTGASYLKEIKEAILAIKKEKNNKIILLHCTANYPCPPKETNLKSIVTLSKEFNYLIGYSDHTSGIMASIISVALGAKILEKHFTLDRNLAGPDHKASLEPQELKELIKAVRETEKMLGFFTKKPQKSEDEVRKSGRRSVVARIDISKGDKISKKMLITKRPGTGISPKYLDKIINRTAKTNILKDTLIKWQMIK
jgi:N,N'-diacetyllegionaminate synthase